MSRKLSKYEIAFRSRKGAPVIDEPVVVPPELGFEHIKLPLDYPPEEPVEELPINEPSIDLVEELPAEELVEVSLDTEDEVDEDMTDDELERLTAPGAPAPEAPKKKRRRKKKRQQPETPTE